MDIKNIVTKKTYKDKEGKEKVVWQTVGALKTTNEGKQYIELFMFPGVPYYVFEQKKKEASGESMDF